MNETTKSSWCLIFFNSLPNELALSTTFVLSLLNATHMFCSLSNCLTLINLLYTSQSSFHKAFVRIYGHIVEGLLLGFDKRLFCLFFLESFEGFLGSGIGRTKIS